MELDCSSCLLQEQMKEGNYELVSKVKRFVQKILSQKDSKVSSLADVIKKQALVISQKNQAISEQNNIVSQRDKMIKVLGSMVREERNKVALLEFERDLLTSSRERKGTEEENEIREEVNTRIEKERKQEA